MGFCLRMVGGVVLAGTMAALWAGDGNVTLRRVATVRVDPSSGRLVRRVVTQRPAAAARELKAEPGIDINRIVDEAARKHNMDPFLVHSVIQVESGYNPYAVSPKGAQGLMQLIPATARDLGVKNPFDPKENIEAGVRYLKQMQEKFQDERLALAAYNAGPGAVTRYGGVPPYAETRHYVEAVGKRLDQAGRDRREDQPAEFAKIEQFIDSGGRLHLRNR